MTSIQTRKVDGYGPYAYRVHGIDHPKAGDYPKYFEYLGPVGKVDPSDLTADETAQLREEGFALARYRDNDSAEFVHLDLANAVRDDLVDEFGEDVLAPTDDRRTTDVQLAEDASPDAVRRATGHAQDDQAEANAGTGQSLLSESERKRIDFTETDVPTAMTAKAAILDEGVDDWLSVWSEDLSTVGEARGAAKRNRESIKGDRLDNDEGPDPDSIGFDEARSEMEEHAMKYVVEEDDETAKEGLVEEFGWEQDDVEALAEMPADAAPV